VSGGRLEPAPEERVATIPEQGAVPIRVSTWAHRVVLVLRTGAHDLFTPPAGNVPGLDVLRSLAILLVISTHFEGDFAAHTRPLAIGAFPLFYFGWTGVDLFFVLSGYLIGRQLWRELVRRNTIDVPSFLLRRGLRIWPFYFAFIAWSYLWTTKSSSAFLPDVFFVSNYQHGAIAGGWSLSTEEQFYVFLPLLLLSVIAVIGAGRQVFVVAGLLFAMPLIRLLTLHAHPGVIDIEQLRRLTQYPFHTHADGLLAGVLISWLSVLHPAVLKPLPPGRNALLPVALAVAGFSLRTISPNVFGFTGLALLFGGMTLFVLRDRSLFSRVASWKGFYVTSRLSYGMYLNHFRVLWVWIPFVVGPNPGHTYVRFALGYPFVILVTMLVSAFTFIVIESPFLQLREQWLQRRTSRVRQVSKVPAEQHLTG
jgi:peptidoglycan/LPS O-acetylase OafA/YrhL